MDHIKTSKVENVTLNDNFNPDLKRKGRIHLTATHFLFIDQDTREEIWVAHSHIANVERRQITTKGSPLKIFCKNFRILNFIVYDERDCQDVYVSLQNLSKPVRYEDLQALTYVPQGITLAKSEGWNVFHMDDEVNRMEVPKDLWRKSDVNKNYKLCPTYPEILYVPFSASDDVVRGSATFRSKGRLPALTYYYKHTKAALCRCSQPMTGIGGRCSEDEQLIKSIISSNPNSAFMYIVDTRPKINAMANKAQGKGYENLDNYPNVLYRYKGIHNIHVMRESLQKLCEVYENSDVNASTFLDSLDNSNWLKHIRAVIESSVYIAKVMLEDKATVVCHCSDGWDRTAQTCALAALFLDPFYRTFKGYQILIEKDWLSFGHKFNHRCGLLHGESREISPIFTQFIECTWQIYQQFPCAFEFNENYLLAIHDHVYSCQFGNFLGNCERDRKEKNFSGRTYSLWGYLSNNVTEYLNPYYDKNYLSNKKGVLTPVVDAQVIRYWPGMFNRFATLPHLSNTMEFKILKILVENTELEKEVQALSTKIASLESNSNASVTDATDQEESVISEHSSNELHESNLVENGGTDARDVNEKLEELKLDPQNRADSLMDGVVNENN